MTEPSDRERAISDVIVKFGPYSTSDRARIVRALCRAIEDAGGCLIYNGRDNYTDFTTRNGERTSVHRVIYTLVYGPMSDDHVVRHTCDVRGCINPAHMLSGTQAMNIRDATLRNRLTMTKARGPKHPGAVLTEGMVAEARRRVRSGENRGDIAHEFGVHLNTICAAVGGLTWTHVAEPPVKARTRRGGGSRAQVDLASAEPAARRLWDEGRLSMRAIGGQVGVSTTVMTKWSQKWRNE